jgi:hypothetical protein
MAPRKYERFTIRYVEDPEDDSRLFAININLGLKKLKEYYVSALALHPQYKVHVHWIKKRLPGALY